MLAAFPMLRGVDGLGLEIGLGLCRSFMNRKVIGN